MIDGDRFDSYYKEKLLPEIIQFEQYRKLILAKYRVWQFIHIIFISIFALIILSFCAFTFARQDLNYEVLYYLETLNLKNFLYLNIITVIAIILSREKMQKILSNFSYAGKYQLFKKIIDADGDMRYYPLSGIEVDTLIASKLFSDFDRYKTKDYIQGEYKNLDVRLSEIELIKIITSYQDSKMIEKEKDLFKGLFISVSMNKKFSSSTYIIPNYWMKIFNQFPGCSRVTLEDVEFEKAFDVYGSDQIEARYILTTGFMERLVKVNRNFQIRCSFIEGQMLIAITLEDGFMPILQLNQPLDYKIIKQVNQRINIIHELIDALNLENNIGL